MRTPVVVEAEAVVPVQDWVGELGLEYGKAEAPLRWQVLAGKRLSPRKHPLLAVENPLPVASFALSTTSITRFK